MMDAHFIFHYAQGKIILVSTAVPNYDDLIKPNSQPSSTSSLPIFSTRFYQQKSLALEIAHESAWSEYLDVDQHKISTTWGSAQPVKDPLPASGSPQATCLVVFNITLYTYKRHKSLHLWLSSTHTSLCL